MRFTTDTMNRIFAFTVLFFNVLFSYAQSIHEDQLNTYNALGQETDYYENLPANELSSAAKAGCNLEKVVYGWHPYWVGSAYQNYQWDLLSHFSFFSYEVNSTDGQPISTHGWSSSAAVTAALASGNTKVTLCVTLFSEHATFFGNPTAQQTLITNLINLVQSRGAHGVNIDFEGLPSSQAVNFANFMVSLSNQMHAAIPNSEVSTVLYAVDWNDVFDFTIMEPAVDQYIIMGYGYYYSGSTNTGPTDPLYHYGSTYNYTLSRSITYYLDKGCPSEKLVLGLPSYGYEWATTATTVPAPTAGGGTARTYAYVKNNSSGNYATGNHSWESDSYTDVFNFNSGGTRQCQISLDSSWSKRLQHVRNTGIAGIGIWALGYDDGYTELWGAIEDYLTDCYNDPCSGTLHDFGGPTRDYYNDENYTWTIAPPNASTIDFDFTLFDVELNYDYLYIYDGPTDQSPQISGSPFTGLAGPGQFTSSSGAVTFKFTSDGATVAPGFLADYQCNTQPWPIASLTYDALQVCSGDSILLVSTSSDADLVSWSTNLGSLSATSGDSVYLVPTVSGMYEVTIQVANSVGSDQSMSSLNVAVFQNNVAAIQVSANAVEIPNATVFFTNNSQNGTSYSWDFGDMSYSLDQNPWHTYTANGVYLGFLVVSNGVCPNDTAYFEINVGTQKLNEVQDLNVVVVPNPFDSWISIETSAFVERVELIDVFGKVVLERELNSELHVSLSTNQLASGMYILRVWKQGIPTTLRLLKE